MYWKPVQEVAVVACTSISDRAGMTTVSAIDTSIVSTTAAEDLPLA